METWLRMFFAALLVMVKNWGHPKKMDKYFMAKSYKRKLYSSYKTLKPA